jgi:hypothetical protein
MSSKRMSAQLDRMLEAIEAQKPVTIALAPWLHEAQGAVEEDAAVSNGALAVPEAVPPCSGLDEAPVTEQVHPVPRSLREILQSGGGVRLAAPAVPQVAPGSTIVPRVD